MDAAQPAAELSFEAALQRLEEIVRILERGEAPLDQSIELRRVTRLVELGDGKPRRYRSAVVD